jgi:hypothetical protein
MISRISLNYFEDVRKARALQSFQKKYLLVSSFTGTLATGLLAKAFVLFIVNTLTLARSLAARAIVLWVSSRSLLAATILSALSFRAGLATKVLLLIRILHSVVYHDDPSNVRLL